MGLAVVSTTFTMAQKKSETDAALAFQSFEKAFQMQDIPNAKKNLLKAKGFIDLAAANAETEKSPKTLFYKGEIYASIDMVRMMNDADFNGQTPADALDIAVSAYKACYEGSDKYDQDIKQSVNTLKMLSDQAGSKLYNEKKFAEASKIYSSTAKLSTAINKVDTVAYYYAAVAAEQGEDWIGAAENYKVCAGYNYKPEITYLGTATSYIKGKKEDEALKFLDDAIAKAPKNKYLFFALGTLYMDKNDDQKVEANLGKAVEIDPAFMDAQYNLGSYFYGKGMDLRNKSVDEKDPATQQKMIDASTEYLKKCASPLEAYSNANPNEKEILRTLWQVHRALKNTEKAAEYKKKLDAAK